MHATKPTKPLPYTQTLKGIATLSQDILNLSATTGIPTAYRLCVRDSYGSGAIRFDLTEPTERSVDEAIRRNTVAVRDRLATRTSLERPRVQMQLVCSGASLLTVVTPTNPVHTGLVDLLYLAIDAHHGVEGFRASNPNQCPYPIPKPLQPKQPVRAHSTNSHTTNSHFTHAKPGGGEKEGGAEHVQHPCTTINALLRQVMDYATGRTETCSTAVSDFVYRHRLQDPDARARLGPVPDRIDDRMGLQNRMVDADPGDLILWRNAFHSTGGTKDKSRCNLTAFLDWTPAASLDQWMIDWMAFGYTHGPVDHGGGKSRGAWQNIVAHARRRAAARADGPVDHTADQTTVPCFGTANVQAYVNTDGTSGREDERPFYKSRAEWAEFEKQGYMVIRTSPDSRMKTLARDIASEFQDTLRWCTGDHHLNLNSPRTTKRLYSREAAKAHVDGSGHPDPAFFYYVDRIDPQHPFDPLRTLGKSHNPQGGGVGVAGDSGMGPMTTVCLPSHLQAQCDPMVRGLMRSFYAHHHQATTTATPELTADEIAQLRMVPVLERVRCKATKTWGNTHVDVDANTDTRVKRERVVGRGEKRRLEEMAEMGGGGTTATAAQKAR